MDKNYRSPICSVLGHVDAGKTSFLDRLRNTSVQAGEPGGITQKIGVTYIKRDTLQELIGQTKNGVTFDVPGIMFVDTPGHECFTAQRMVGTEISDLVILVIDIFKGLEIQTIESLNLLRKSKTPCLIIANKVDRVNNWKSVDGRNIRESLRSQNDDAKGHYTDLINHLIVQCAEQNLNAALYYKNTDYRSFISIVPFSAKTGEGMPDLLMMISILCTKYLLKRIKISNEITTGFLIERILTKTLGAVITTVLTDGKIEQGDRLIFKDVYGDVCDSKINRIFVPTKNTEVKDKVSLDAINLVDEPKSVVLNLDYGGEILAGTRFYVYHDQNQKDEYTQKLTKLTVRESERADYEYSKEGVYLIAPTIGMMEGLLSICTNRCIRISGSKIGNITKSDIIRANPNLDARTDDEKIMFEKYSVILAYGIQVTKEIQDKAARNGVRIFTSDIIYHLLDMFDEFTKSIDSKIRKRNPNLHTPFRAKILPKFIFRTDNPILVGVKVEHGTIYSGQTVVANNEDDRIKVGVITSIQNNKNNVEVANVNSEVCLKIDNSETQKKLGKDFDESYEIMPFYTESEAYLISTYPEVFDDKITSD